MRPWEAELDVLFLSNKHGVYSEVYSRNALCYGPNGLELGQALDHCAEWDYRRTESWTATGWWRMCHTALLKLQWAPKEMWWRRLPTNTNPECWPTWDLKPRFLGRNTSSAQNTNNQIHTECNMSILTAASRFVSGMFHSASLLSDYMRVAFWSPKNNAIYAHFYEPENITKDLIKKNQSNIIKSLQKSLRQANHQIFRLLWVFLHS